MKEKKSFTVDADKAKELVKKAIVEHDEYAARAYLRAWGIEDVSSALEWYVQDVKLDEKKAERAKYRKMLKDAEAAIDAKNYFAKPVTPTIVTVVQARKAVEKKLEEHEPTTLTRKQAEKAMYEHFNPVGETHDAEWDEAEASGYGQSNRKSLVDFLPVDKNGIRLTDPASKHIADVAYAEYRKNNK